jgi:hypothetical protein
MNLYRLDASRRLLTHGIIVSTSMVKSKVTTPIATVGMGLFPNVCL